jgi:hypothetical protein
MNETKPAFPTIAEEDRTPLVDALLELLAWQANRIEALEQEILKLKGETTKPKIKPSKMDDEDDNSSTAKKSERPPKTDSSKAAPLKIDENIIIKPENVPTNSRFKGYRRVVVQDLIIKTHNACYWLAEYQTPDGGYLSGQLPEAVKGCHFGKDLIAFILYQYHHQHVTQPLLLEQLHDLGIQISSGRLSQFITENLDVFHQEKDALLEAGMKVSRYVQTDDTGARHDGKNGYCTYIGNELFSWFNSTESKSRINFLSLLQQGLAADYVLNAGALEYMARQKLPKNLLERLELQVVTVKERTDWEKWLTEENIASERHRRIITEGTLIGGLLAQGIPADFGIVSDDAGQFNVFDHALCWIHAERGINRLLPVNDLQVQAVEQARDQVWTVYRDLKAYKLQPQPELAQAIRLQFANLVETKTCYATLNQVLKQFGKNQHELLRVLDKAYLPLHNNLSERDIREYVKKRKISNSTRSEAGRRCRDTFASLKKTCRKQGVSFWAYLKARLLGDGSISPLTELIQLAAAG